MKDITANENNKQSEDGQGIAASSENKIFTQDEVNRIVAERLTKEKDRVKREQDALFAEKEQEIAKREMRITAIEKLQEKGLSTLLVDAINCSSHELIDKSIEILSKTQNAQENRTVYMPKSGETTLRDPIRDAMGL